MRKEFEMTEAQLAALMDASKPVPMMMLQCGTPSSPQENANAAWVRLGAELGFKHMTVQPVGGKGSRFFTAEVVEEVSIAFKAGQDAQRRGLKLHKSALTSLHPASKQYADFIAGYDSPRVK